MEKLNELVALAEKADAVANLMDGVNPPTILAVAEAFRALEQRAETAEAALERESDIHIDTAESMREWRVRAEAAEALNNHLELAVRKAEGVSESLRRRAEDAEDKLLFTRPVPAADLAELVPPMKDDSMPGKNDSYIDMCDGWNACRSAILRNIEDAK